VPVFQALDLTGAENPTEDYEMTTLKTYHADEIASALDAQLKDEGFIGMYKQAQAPVANWWDKGPTAKAFKAEVDAAKTTAEVDAVQNKYLGGGDLTTKLGQEGIDDHTPLRNYADQAAGQKAPAADDKDGCPQHDEAKDGCPECADAANLAVAIDFAIRHIVKVADALDRTGYVGVAGVLDEAAQKLAASRPIVSEAARSYKEWVSFLRKKSPKAADKFKKAYKGALQHAKKEKDLGAEKAEEYAMRTALDGVPKSYLKEPTPAHGKGKSGPLAAKR
jgi:hypothetical protein